jgi:hypothetical protein
VLYYVKVQAHVLLEGNLYNGYVQILPKITILLIVQMECANVRKDLAEMLPLPTNVDVNIISHGNKVNPSAIRRNICK